MALVLIEDDVDVSNAYKTKGKQSVSFSKVFPDKLNRKYLKHFVKPYGSWMIDLMFTDELCYLVAININTRKLFVMPTNFQNDDEIVSDKKSTKSFLKALDSFISNGMNPRVLYFDKETAFMSRESQKYYDNKLIDVVVIPPSKSHIRTSPVDRVIRTLRDMAYNINPSSSFIPPKLMSRLVELYNSTFHNGLKKWLKRDVSPNMMTHELEMELIRRISKANYNIIHQPGYKLDIGTIVKLKKYHTVFEKRRSSCFNELFIVDDNSGPFIVRGLDSGVRYSCSRFQIASVKNKK